ncbi:MAG TPA: IS200/IS605 family transposase [Chloroflexota bacterium]|nr:IS200/IS605 family transposase [Chloroflexota bacterium]
MKSEEQRIVYHFVWGPMRAKPCLIGDAAQRLETLIRETAATLALQLGEVQILPDRVYVAVAAPPTLSPHRIVCRFKAYSSRCLRHEFQEMTKIPTLWTRAYVVRAGEHYRPEQVMEVYETSLPPRRRAGRPRVNR